MLVFNHLISLEKLNMPACATPQDTTYIPYSGNLILPVPDTDFRDYLDEVDELVRFAPEIVVEIERDLDAHALKKKRLRLADQKFFEGQTGDLPKLDIQERDILAEELDLAVGRPRMSGYAVYLFLMLRGFLGSLSSKPARQVRDVTWRIEQQNKLEASLTELNELKARADAENITLREELHSRQDFREIVGQSAVLMDVLAQIEKVAPTDATVLLTGETGTGKDLMARAIHQHSNRREELFLSVNCASLPAGLVESELFGHEKGAFTGATS
jgi:hypothetical protein